jgi:hypothetical protein
VSVWTVICEPVEANPDDTGNNQGGLVVYLTNGDRRKEVSRVAYVRRNSKNPKTSFEKQLRKEMDKGAMAAKTINDANAAVTEAQKALETAEDDLLNSETASTLQ